MVLEIGRPLNVTYRSAPFGGRVHQTALPQGLSCAEIVATVPDLNTRRFLENGVVCINGEPVPREMWPFVRPKSRQDIIVTLHMPIRGGAAGGGGGKSVLRLVATIALIAVASFISGGGAAAFLGAGFGAGTLGATLLAGAITIGGALLLGAFVKPPSNKVEKEQQEDSAATASLQGNQLRRGAGIPRVVGTHRCFPPFLSQPLVDLVEYDEVVEATYGLAGPHNIRSVKFGDVFADDIDPELFQYQFYELKPGEGGIDENTRVMLHFNGIQDSTLFVDSSPHERTFTLTGNVFIDKVLRETWLGRAAAYFNQNTGIGPSFLTTPFTPDLAIGDQDFSIEFVLEWDETNITTPTIHYLCGQGSGSSGIPTAANTAWYIAKGLSGALTFAMSDGSVFTSITTTTNVEETPEDGKYHFVVERRSGLLRALVNGVQEGGVVSAAGSIQSLSSPLTIGAHRTTAGITDCWPGWINEFRMQVGASGIDDDFDTPPEVPYRPDVPDLITRYAKTAAPSILLAEHRIKNDESGTQPGRDRLNNQIVPARSLPLAQTLIVRGTELDEIWVTLGFPAGLSYFDDAFERDWFNGMAFRIRVREVGSRAWHSLPEVHLHERRTGAFSRLLVFRWDNEELIDGSPGVTPPVQKGWKAAYTSVPTQTLTPSGTGGWAADEHFQASGNPITYLIGVTSESTSGSASTTGLRNIRLTQERVEFFLTDLVDRGPLEIEITRSQLYIADKFTYATYNMNTDPPADSLSNGVVDLFGYVTLDGVQVILLKQSNSGDQVQISRAAAVWNRPPIARWGTFAPLYIRARGRALDALSTVASGLVSDWDGQAWTGLGPTSNPAPHYRDVLVGPLNDNRIEEDMVDDTVLVEWRTRCATLGLECNAVFDGVPVDRALTTIASCGYARPRQSEVWDVAQDRDFSLVNPVQMFGPRNMRGFRWEKLFLRHRPDGLRVKFSNSEDDYNERTIIVPRPGVLDATAGGRLEEIRYDGIVTERAAVTRAVYDQQQVLQRFTFYHGEVDAENLVCRRGDLVLVQHDILDSVAGFSRVLDVLLCGDVVDSITLDGSVAPPSPAFFEETPQFFVEPTNFFTTNVIGVAIRLKDGTAVTFNATVSDDGFTLYPLEPISGIGDLLERECLVMTGLIARNTRRLIVFSITPRADLTAQLTFVDEAPGLFDFPADVPPEPPQVSAVRMHHQYVEVPYEPEPGAVQMSHQYVEVPYEPEPGAVQMSHQYVEVVYEVDPADLP